MTIKSKVSFLLFPLVILTLLFNSCKKEVDLSNLQYGTVKDFDGTVYSTVIIGNQEWMAENLKTKHFSNGTPILKIEDDTQWKTASSPATCYYNHDSLSNNVNYGRLYNWNTVVSENNVCPDAWHVPSEEEWEELFDNLGGDEQAGAKMKSLNTTTWMDPNDEIATNEAQLNVEPGGLRDENGKFYNLNYFAYFWTSSESNSEKSWAINLSYVSDGAGQFEGFKSSAYSIRCVKD